MYRILQITNLNTSLLIMWRLATFSGSTSTIPDRPPPFWFLVFIFLPYYGWKCGWATHSWLGRRRCSELAIRSWLPAVWEPNQRSANPFSYLKLICYLKRYLRAQDSRRFVVRTRLRKPQVSGHHNHRSTAFNPKVNISGQTCAWSAHRWESLCTSL